MNHIDIKENFKSIIEFYNQLFEFNNTLHENVITSTYVLLLPKTKDFFLFKYKLMDSKWRNQ